MSHHRPTNHFTQLRGLLADRCSRRLGVDEENVDTVIDIALRSQTHIWTNPRPVDSALLRETLLLALHH
ncbi:MAG: hypothetical protein GY798_00255 [Hyphomicrobiales bacterium]|nr:hypothetical protein [Hyphomicrobiales bacterium]